MIEWPVEIIDSKYRRWYEGIINKANKRGLPAKKSSMQYDGNYTELHHIVPRSFGGKDDKTNLVRFTAREHFICHWLLVKMTTGKHRAKMVTALIMMTGQGSKSARYSSINKNSKWYEKIRKEYAEQVSKRMSGRKVSEETKKKLSIAKTGTKMSDEVKRKQSERQKGKPRNLSEEGRKRLIEALKNKVVVVSEETRKKHSINNSGAGNPFYGKKHSQESMEKIREYHSRPEIKKQKSERTMGDKNPAKRSDVRLSISKSQKERLDKERATGTGYFSAEQKAKRSEVQTGAKNGNAKTFKCTSPNGEVHMVTGRLKKFCKEYNLSYGSILGKDIVEHRGWTIEFIPKK
jgi:hypothetical protein